MNDSLTAISHQGVAMDITLSTILKEKQDALFSVDPEATVKEAVDVMVSGGVGCVLVLDKGELVGLFTERDLMRRVAHRGLDPATTPIREVMTTDVATVSPSLNVGEAMSLCTSKRLRHLPVFDGGTLLGVISAGDLTKWAVDDQQHIIDDLFKYIYDERA